MLIAIFLPVARHRSHERLSYKALDKILRVTKNPDYFAGLPMQTAEAVVHQAVNNFNSWLKALRDYKKNTTK